MRQNNNVRLERYSTASILQNWRVFVNEQHVGDVHNCDGSIGGHIGELTETSVFDDVCAMAKNEVNMSDSYKPNVYDAIHDVIASLYKMKTELNHTEGRFLTDSTRQLVVEYMVEEMMERHNPALPSQEDLLTNGHRGFANYTDLELAIECQQTIAGWCGQSANEEDEAIFPFNIVYKEVAHEIDMTLNNAVENSILK